MKLLSRYLFSTLARPFWGTLVTILAVLAMERTLRLIDAVSAQGAPAEAAFSLLLKLIPHYLGLAIPAALFLGTLLGLRRHAEASELTAMHTAGIPARRLLFRLGLAGSAAGLIMLVISGWLQPLSRYAFHVEMNNLSRTAALNLPPQQFTTAGGKITLRAESARAAQDGQVIRGFFAHVKRDNGTEQMINAREARMTRPADPGQDGQGQTVFKLRQGTIIELRPGQKPTALRFARTSWKPERPAFRPYGPRGQDEREKTLPELLTPLSSNQAAHRAELHGRLVTALSAPFLVLLAAPLALFGLGRNARRMGRYGGLVTGIVLLVLYEKILGFGQAATAQGANPFLTLWLPWAGLGGLSLLLIRLRIREL